MITRRSVWSDPVVQERLRAFIPAADEVGHLQRSLGPEGELFREIAEQGHYKGRTKPTNTRQGIYACAPDGTFLASVNTRRASDLIAMLDRAEAAFEVHRAEDNQTKDHREQTEASDLDDAAAPRFLDLYPSDGLVLRVHSRDLPRDDAPDDWRAEASNRDFAWFRNEELVAMIPETTAEGVSRDWPKPLAVRLAQLHLVDNVRGQVSPLEEEHVLDARITTTIVEVHPDHLTVRFDGAFRTLARETSPVNGFEDREAPTERERGFEGQLLGKGEFDLKRLAFRAIELVVAGERHGGTQYNARADDLGKSPIGFVLVKADDEERTEPATFWKYGWR